MICYENITFGTFQIKFFSLFTIFVITSFIWEVFTIKSALGLLYQYIDLYMIIESLLTAKLIYIFSSTNVVIHCSLNQFRLKEVQVCARQYFIFYFFPQNHSLFNNKCCYWFFYIIIKERRRINHWFRGIIRNFPLIPISFDPW